MSETGVEQIHLRRVTNAHVHWTQGADGEPGTFTLRIILDDGALEISASPSVKELKTALQILRATDAAYLDLYRQSVSIGGISIGWE